ncbi:hypothetical protein [Macrococcoides caseolyticum]|uniref:hypothetical protein n=1 Tax=Macrococcoides caseolyticum TaxID=69966 RepID=UPI001F18C49F|nr:hypothetical protein [Macrococcus caseolyticus]MCE4958001.1 hypothetical protein [Macrococcus caseolyticus]
MKPLHYAILGGTLDLIGITIIVYALIYNISVDSFEGVIAGVLLTIGVPMFFRNLAHHLDSKRE